MAEAELTSWEIFSSNVRRWTRSRALSAMGNVVLQKGYDVVEGSEESQEKGGDPVESTPTRTRRAMQMRSKGRSFILWGMEGEQRS